MDITDINKAIQSALKYYQEGNLQRAECIANNTLTVQSDNIFAVNMLGTIYYQLKNYDAAIG